MIQDCLSCKCLSDSPCVPNPCQNGGTCSVNGDGVATCACKGDYSGPTCSGMLKDIRKFIWHWKTHTQMSNLHNKIMVLLVNFSERMLNDVKSSDCLVEMFIC